MNIVSGSLSLDFVRKKMNEFKQTEYHLYPGIVSEKLMGLLMN